MMSSALPPAEVFRLDGDLPPAWLAHQLDEQGVVRFRDAVSAEWLDAMRESVLSRIEHHGDGDLFIAHPDREAGSPAHQLMTDPALRRLLEDTAALRCPTKSLAAQKYECNVPVRNGRTRRIRPNLFHYDPSVLTIVVPLFIPRAAVGHCGELVAFGNKRPFRRFAVTHLIEKALTHNALHRRHLARKVSASPEEYIVDLQPGDAYAFWGYRQFHGNLDCAPGLLRATLVISFGDVHADSWLVKVAWRFSRSRRNMVTLRCPPVRVAAGTA